MSWIDRIPDVKKRIFGQPTIDRDGQGRIVKGSSIGKDSRFKPRQTPWNKGKRGYMGANATSFKKGQLPASAHEIGHVSRWERTRNGKKEIEYIINIDWHGNRKPHNTYKWYLWEVENQQDRPKGMVLALKNGNPDDIRIENLELITRSELLKRNQGMA